MKKKKTKFPFFYLGAYIYAHIIHAVTRGSKLTENDVNEDTCNFRKFSNDK